MSASIPTRVKVFISHSSDDKALVHALADIIGKNGLVVDEYDFQSGQRTEDEIDTAIRNSTVFCLLISKTSIAKKWVRMEISKYKKFVEDYASDKFLPLIVDEDISWDCKDIPKWISHEYNLRDKYTVATFLARRIEEELTRLRWQSSPEAKKRELAFIGRDKEFGEIYSRYINSNLTKVRAVIVSGIPDGIGRRRIITELIRRISTNRKETFKPMSISIDRDKSIEDFVLLLNFLLLAEKNDALIAKLNSLSPDEKVELAVDYLVELFNRKEPLFIRDNGTIVRKDGSLVDWFESIIESPRIKEVGMFVASRHRFLDQAEYPEIVSYPLLPLSQQSAKDLLRTHLNILGKSVSDADALFFVERTSNMPALISKCADIINEVGPETAKHNERLLGYYSYKGDDLVRSLIDCFNDSPDHIKMLLLLSEIDFLTYRHIKEICRDEIKDIDRVLEDLLSISIYDHFGTNSEYIKMNPIVADKVRKSRYRLDPKLWDRLQTRVNEIIDTLEINDADMGLLVRKIENEIKGDIRNINHSHILPSIALKVIVDEYGKHIKDGFVNAIAICDTVLDNCGNVYADIVKRVQYYRCASYAQLGDRRFFDYLPEIEDDYEKAFLEGIYSRRTKEYTKAEKFFRRAMRIRPNSHAVKNELAISLQRQGTPEKYAEALLLSKDVYEKQPANPFYIVTYFKSLVCSDDVDDALLQTLIQQLKSAWDRRRDSFSKMLEAEYAYFRENNFDKAMGIYRSTLKAERYQPIFTSAHEICCLAGRKNEGDRLGKEFGFD